MKLSLTPDELTQYVVLQLNTFFPLDDVKEKDISPLVKISLERIEACFLPINRKYYRESGEVIFNHLNTDHYATFLYFLANSAFRHRDEAKLPSKVYALNKALHSIEANYEISLPEIFMFVHPVGSVLGRAQYSDYFCVYQGCTVGANVDGSLPVIGEGVVLYSGVCVIGDSAIGNNCMISAGTTLVNGNVPDNSVCFRDGNDISIRQNVHDVKETIFHGTTS